MTKYDEAFKLAVVIVMALPLTIKRFSA